MVKTAGATIRSVVQGVLGVAVIQSLLAGIVGLFIGAVVLALGFQLTIAWVQRGNPVTEESVEAEPAPA